MPQQVGSFSQIFPYICILGIHCVTCGDKCKNAAGTHFIEGFGKKIVVNGEAQLIVFRVVDLILAEWHVANGKVKEIVRESCLFVACDIDLRIGIQQLRDASADAVQLRAVQLRFRHFLWK